jgi:glucan phosphorylase
MNAGNGVRSNVDERYRLCQEAVLGIAGVRLLRALGHENIARFHCTKVTPPLLTLALFEEIVGRPNLASATNQEIEAVCRQCVFTLHTPVPAAFDQFPLELARKVLGKDRVGILGATGELYRSFAADKITLQQRKPKLSETVHE